jgi:membrane protease YdiL (CAAX protease family)
VSPQAETSHEPTWDYNDIVLFIFLSLLSIGATQVLSWLVVRLLHIPAQDRPLVALPSQIVLYALLLGALYLIIKLQYGRSFLNSLAWVNFSMGIGHLVFLGVALALINGIASVFLHTPDTDTPIKHLFNRRITAIEFGVIGVTIGPLCEELVFRGFIQPVVVRSLGPALGILITAVLFGSLHLAQNGFAWQSGLLITLAGVAFGWMRHLTGSTRASTIMHCAYNFTFFLAVFGQSSHLPTK